MRSWMIADAGNGAPPEHDRPYGMWGLDFPAVVLVGTEY